MKEKVTSLNCIADGATDLNQLAAELCCQVEGVYEGLLSGSVEQTLNEWRALSVTLGQEIKFNSGNREIEATAIDITPTGALIVQTVSGRKELTGGEISIRNSDGTYC